MVYRNLLYFRFLQLSLDMEKIKSSDAPLVIGKVAENSHIGQQIAWDFILKHWSTLETRWGSPPFLSFVNCIWKETK